MAWLTERLVSGEPSYDHTPESVRAVWEAPFPDLIFAAMQVHRRTFDPLKVQSAALLSVKTGGCPEDCKYCPQSARFETGADKTPLMDPEQVRLAARAAKAAGAERFCMGAAWRRLRDRDVPLVAEMIRLVKEEGMESCVTLGMAEEDQLRALKEAGLDYYNHNIDTSPEYYDQIITTRTFEDRLRTLEAVRAAGVRVCCGGIIGMGETPEDRLGFLRALANMNPHPESVPVNRLIPVPGTPLAGAEPPSEIDFVRVVATARLLMPRSVIRLSAGRETMSDSLQALCFLAGANSVFAGEKLLTAGNPGQERDASLFATLGMRAGGGSSASERECH